MSDLTGKFSVLEAELTEQSETAQTTRANIYALLGAMSDTIDAINNNNAVNTRLLLNAIGQSGACFPCPTPSMTVPPITTTPTTISTASCQRSQAIIATIHNILAQMDVMMSYNVVATFNVLNDAIGDVIAAIVAGDTVPLPTFPEVVNLVGSYFSYVGERIFSGVGLVEQFEPLETSLINGIWGAATASAARAQYVSIIEGSDVSFAGKFVIENVAYNALWSYYYDTATSPDVSGFDGSFCGIGGCLTVPSASTSINGGSSIAFIDWPAVFLPVNAVGSLTSNHYTWATRDFTNWVLTPAVDAFYYITSSDAGNYLTANVPVTLGSDVDLMAIRRSDASNTPFTIQICPPS